MSERTAGAFTRLDRFSHKAKKSVAAVDPVRHGGAAVSGIYCSGSCCAVVAYGGDRCPGAAAGG